MTLSNYLQFLGISFKSNPNDIEKAYKKLSKRFLAPRMDAGWEKRPVVSRRPALARFFKP